MIAGSRSSTATKRQSFVVLCAGFRVGDSSPLCDASGLNDDVDGKLTQKNEPG